MSTWMRRIRGAVGMGVVWGMAWLAAGLVLLVIIGPNAADVPFPLFFGLLGFLAGVTFSLILGMVEGRRRFDQMSMPRFALWGGAGGLLLSVGLSALVGIGALPLLALIFTLAGAGCASGSLALARLADDRDGGGLSRLDRGENPGASVTSTRRGSNQ